MDSTYSKKNSEFKNAFKDRRCFILGNGPSIKSHDLSRLRQEHVFVVNLFPLHSEFHNFVNCFYCMGDPRFYNNQKLLPEITSHLIQHKSAICFFEKHARSAVLKEHSLDLERIFFVEIDPDQKCWNGAFHADVTRKVCWGYSVIIDQCLPLAIHMGFNPIYLLGCDCDYKVDPAKPDFKDAYFYDPKNISEDYLESLYHSSQLPDQFNLSGKITESYLAVKKYCDNYNILIFNAGVGGKLNVFKRVDYMSIFV